jgi:hypothetical protein
MGIIQGLYFLRVITLDIYVKGVRKHCIFI